jgi:hypothetical protein
VLGAVPSLVGAPRESLVFTPHDVKIQTISYLIHRLHAGAEHLLIGYLSVGRPLLKLYCWGLLATLLFGLAVLGFRFLRERFEIQHLVLTVVGFLGFQVAYFFRDAISTWPRYFILYLPYVALLIPLSLSRAFVLASQPAQRRNWAYGIVLVIVFVAGSRQLHYNYQHPYIDHGADFRAIYRHLIGRVTPRDKIVVGGNYNQKTLLYYWPTARQVETRYVIGGKDRTNPPPNIWIVNHKFDERVEYKKYAADLEKMGYRLAVTRRVSGVSIHQFVRAAPPQNLPESTALGPPAPPKP